MKQYGHYDKVMSFKYKQVLLHNFKAQNKVSVKKVVGPMNDLKYSPNSGNKVA